MSYLVTYSSTFIWVWFPNSYIQLSQKAVDNKAVDNLEVAFKILQQVCRGRNFLVVRATLMFALQVQSTNVNRSWMMYGMLR